MTRRFSSNCDDSGLSNRETAAASNDFRDRILRPEVATGSRTTAPDPPRPAQRLQIGDQDLVAHDYRVPSILRRAR